MSRDSDTVFVGNLPGDTRERELDDIFHKYGKIVKIDVKAGRGGAGFAFVQFDDTRDASDAVRARDGYDFDGKRIRVELTRGSGPRGPGGRPMRDGDRGGYDDRRGGDRYDRGGGGRGGGGPPRRSDYKLIVEGLPNTGSWQDLKDHLKSAGEICFADVNRDGTGIVEFEKQEDLKYAIKKYDDTKFTSHKGETAYIRLKEGSGSSSSSFSRRDSGRGGGRGRDRSPSRSRSRSPPARRRGGSPSRSRSGSPRKSRSRSRSASPPRGSPSPKRAARRSGSESSRSRSRSGERRRDDASPAQRDRSASPASHGSRSPSR